MTYKHKAGTVALLMILAAACGAPVQKKEPAVFFPPAPELPRVQYLTHYSGLTDIVTQSSFNRFVAGEQQDIKIEKPYGVAIHDGKIYVCDSNTTVLVFDLKAKAFGPLRGAIGPGRLVQPLNISIESDGTKYVSDPVRGQIVVFNAQDEYVRALGQPGAWKPVDAVPFEDRLYVADMASSVVKVLDKQSGDLIKTIGDKGDRTERLDRPTNLAFDREGSLYVTDVTRFQVVKFDRDGHFKAAFGKPGDNLGHFARPKGIALDRDNLLYAVDAAFNNVQIFNEKGQLLMFFGQGGENPGSFTLPAKVAIDYDNLQYFQEYLNPGFVADHIILVTSQFGPRLVNVFAYGKEKGRKYPTDEELIKERVERFKKELEKNPAPAPKSDTGTEAQPGSPPAPKQEDPQQGAGGTPQSEKQPGSLPLVPFPDAQGEKPGL